MAHGAHAVAAWLLYGKAVGGGLMIDSRRLTVCRAVSRDAVQHIASQKKTQTSNDHSRNLHLVRESCTFCSLLYNK